MIRDTARCRRCNAPLKRTPETIVAICERCGFPNWISQAFIHPIELVPAKTWEATKLLNELARSDPALAQREGKIAIKTVETIYIPLYLARIEASSGYEGVATVTLAKSKPRNDVKPREEGEREVKRYVTVKVNGSITRSYTLAVPAKRIIKAGLVTPLMNYYLKARPASKPLTSISWDEVKGMVLPVEVTPQDAMVWARDAVCDRLSSEVESLMEKEAEQKAVAVSPGWRPNLVIWSHKRISCKPEDRELSPLILVPLVLLYYTYAKGVFRAAFAGWDGTIIGWDRPEAHAVKRSPLAGATLVSSLFGGAGAALLAAGDPLSGSLFFLVGVGGTAVLSRHVLRGHVDSGGKGG